MKRFLISITILALASVAFPAIAPAQKSYAIAIGGGPAIPVGTLKDSQNTGIGGIVALALGTPDLPIGVRFDGIYNRFSRIVVNTPQSGTVANSDDFRIAALLGNLIYAFPGSTAKGYVIAGGGFYNTRFEAAGSKSENDPGLNAGAGLTFAIGPIASFIEARYHFIRRAPENGGVIHFVPLTIGLMF